MTAKQQKRSRMAGFSMIELLVAVSLFLVIGGAALTLFKQHAPLFTQQQNMTNLNITMRNAMAQMQMDIVNAGTGYYPGVNFPNWPIGVTIQNNPASSSCYNSSTNTYSSTCFDTLNVILMDPNTPPSHPSTSSGGCVLTTATTIYATPPTGTTAAALAADFNSGDQILLVNSTGSQMTTTLLTAAPTVSGSMVVMTHNATNTDGTNTTTNDPLGMTTHTGDASVGTSFCSADWVMRLQPVTYQVDASNQADPKLTRTQNGTTNVVAEQIIGFKVGATVWNAASNTSSEFYNFDSSIYSYNYSLIRSVQLSMVGRTSPSQNGGSSFTNNFDGGHYQIQAIEVEVNPRNLSMRDN